jgi:hypothetical protein
VRITIDNLDGKGAVDYTVAVAAEGPVTVQRTLNEPSRCTAEFVVGAQGLALPVRRGRVAVTADSGAVLFTGYVVTQPVRVYAGAASEGAVYRARVSAVSDEWLLDNLGSGANAYDAVSVGLTSQTLLQRLAARLQAGASGLLAVGAGAVTAVTGVFAPKAGESWSKNAGAAASAAYAGYRAQSGAVTVQPVGTVVHALSDADGTLSISELSTARVRELANDVTLTGAEEPAAYVQEVFQGDGTTTVFELSEAAYREPVANGLSRTLLLDSFNEAGFDATQWVVSDAGAHLSLTGAGLTMNGGTGVDGATTLTALDAVEMGGAIVAQLGGVVLGAASDGMLAGFYNGASVLADCFAGFRVRQNGGVTVLVPVVNGVEVGTVFTPVAGHAYTLRLRLHCVEMQRVMQRYYCMVDGVVQGFGALSGVNAPMDLVFDLVDEGAASNTPATVLYDSAAAGAEVTSSPGTCAFVVVNATQMVGSVSAVSVTRPGSLWVVSTLPGGTLQTRLVGLAGQGVDCTATYGTAAGTPGKVTFLAGRVPAAGERVAVSYRVQQRAVARLEDAASVAAEAAGGGLAGLGTCRWLGKVLEPVARSSADCENAAQAVLAFATSATAALAGTYTCWNPAQDVSPGDVLAVTSDGVTSSLLVRSVTVEDGHAAPELLRYKIAFANDWAAEWADGLGLKLSEEIAVDAVLPQTASSGPGEVLANLQQLTVSSLTETALQVDAGTAPPAGGGFEVRRKDWEFGVGLDPADLVLRSPVRGFSMPRAAQVERFYVRMYDGSSPPVYSRFSSAVFVNWPVG